MGLNRFTTVGFIRMLVNFLRSLFCGEDKGPADPYAGVRAPVRRGPPDRRSVVALDEP